MMVLLSDLSKMEERKTVLIRKTQVNLFMNSNIISGYDVRQSLRLALLAVLSCLLFIFNSCSGSKDHTDDKEYIDVYYAMGYVDSDGPCEKDFVDSEVFDKGRVFIDREEYEAITKLLAGLEALSDSVTSTYGMCLQSNFHFADSSYSRICIGQFGDITVDSKPFARKDSLVYLLRQHSGFYNHYNREDLTRFCNELSSFNIPENYQDLTTDLDTTDAFYAKIRILIE